MSETNYFRLIEAYFDGSISPVQKGMLEIKIQTDPLLKAEFDLQSNIIDSIAHVRKQQLKARLSAIDVDGTGSILLGTGVKWLTASLSVAIIFSAWLYWYTNTADDNKAIALQNGDLLIWNNDYYPPIPSVLMENALFEIENTASIKDTTTENSSNNNNVEIIESTENETAKIKPQALVTFQDENLFSPTSEKDFIKTADQDINRNMISETKIEFLEPIEAQESYHYKYYNNKLYLYGDFNNEPYEILELHNKGKKQLYLSYLETIYQIEGGKTLITPLIEVKNEQLILELRMILNQE
jgi:hypothetical protein